MKDFGDVRHVDWIIACNHVKKTEKNSGAGMD